MKLKEFLIQNREVAQLIYGILLIVLIPLLVVFNTVFIINRYNRALDVGLQRSALALGRAMTPLLVQEIDNQNFLSKQINFIKANNQDILEISVLKPKNQNDFIFFASSEKDLIGQTVSFYYYQLAWNQPINDALVTDSLLLAKNSAGRLLPGALNGKDRFWLLAKPLANAQGEKQALLTLKISSEIVDNLTRYNRNLSVFMLVITILVIMLFLIAAIRLWDYALLYKKIKEVDKMKDEFISMASHELRTPVTGIKGYSSMIADGSLGKVNKEVKKSAGIIFSSAERLSALVEDLLSVSRIEQGRLQIKMRPMDIVPVLKNIITELKVQAKEKNLSLKLDLGDRDSVTANLDPERLSQIMVNIVGNAIKYTNKGEVLVRVVLNKDKLKIITKDTGIGMSSEDRKHLFEKFYRIRNEKTKNINGTGLGMWISKKLVELMKGKIIIESMENVGTQVSLIFPLGKK